MNKQTKIFDSLVMLSVALGQKQDPKRLHFYVEKLKGYDLAKVLFQIENFADKSKFFPQLVEILEPLKGLDVPTDELATIMASEIIESISRFGSHQGKEAAEFLGEKFQIIERSGGWAALCQITYDEIPTTRAQLRELAKAYINRSKREARDEIGFQLNTEARQISQHQLRTPEVTGSLLKPLSNNLKIVQGDFND